MKLAGALLALASLVTVVVIVVAVTTNRDDLPGDLRSCSTQGGATVVHGPINLGVARREIAARAVRRVRTLSRGDDSVVLLAGSRFRLLVLRNDSSPRFAADLPKQLFEHADQFPLVAIEVDPVRDVLRGCAQLVTRRS